jgi:hypothetical protein
VPFALGKLLFVAAGPPGLVVGRCLVDDLVQLAVPRRQDDVPFGDLVPPLVPLRITQPILANGSPTSLSTTRMPPNPICIITSARRLLTHLAGRFYFLTPLDNAGPFQGDPGC